ncbi:DUF2993 domain-containing protein [Gloeobacter morelensis]|uniref:DUF2993 domain-containing protein n=1 Tax=Gloeobacter morelensis MG652769 TaxID=2781736 RepID=A0ABY3PR56_9CYAN|nr:DUF2993 domain-containing protein [Gloeobacter morelensis]UFP96182.1 DUF2993 domain-containing protein [Gloeobacter morelensis MG652769]
MAENTAGLGEQALNKVAEIGLSSQLREVENMDVSIKTDPLKLITGEVDSVSVEGEGLVMQKNLRVEKMEIEAGRISINPLAAAMGKIELEHPTEATCRVLLTEADINRSFNSEYILGMLQNLQVEADGQQLTIDTRQVEVKLPGSERIRMQARIFIHQTREERGVTFDARLVGDRQANRVRLEDVQYSEGEALSQALTAGLLQKANDLGNIGNFELEGMSLKLLEFEVRPGALQILVEIYAEQFPS